MQTTVISKNYLLEQLLKCYTISRREIHYYTKKKGCKELQYSAENYRRESEWKLSNYSAKKKRFKLYHIKETVYIETTLYKRSHVNIKIILRDAMFNCSFNFYRILFIDKYSSLHYRFLWKSNTYECAGLGLTFKNSILFIYIITGSSLFHIYIL